MQGTITTVVRMALWRVANTQLSFNRRVGDISLYTQLFTRKIHREMFYTIAILLFIIINGKPLSIGKKLWIFFYLVLSRPDSYCKSPIRSIISRTKNFYYPSLVV